MELYLPCCVLWLHKDHGQATAVFLAVRGAWLFHDPRRLSGRLNLMSVLAPAVGSSVLHGVFHWWLKRALLLMRGAAFSAERFLKPAKGGLSKRQKIDWDAHPD